MREEMTRVIKKLVMTKDQKNEVIEVLKEKFSQYNNFYITDTEALSVKQISNLRRFGFRRMARLKLVINGTAVML